MFCLVREFLEFFDLNFTISVYEPESYLGSAYTYEGRCKIVEDLGLPEIDENSRVPLLLQLIKLAQHTKEIVNDTCNDKSQCSVEPNSEVIKNKNKRLLNETFDISNGSVNEENNRKFYNSANDKSHLQKHDESDTNTYSDILDISNENISLLDLEKNIKNTLNKSQMDNEKAKSSIDHSLTEHDKSPILKDSKLTSKFETTIDKIKLSSQKDKLKTKNNLSSLADLPPLQLNKPRDTMVLPSLYNKEFKDRKSDFDQFLDVDTFDNYEEDFMSSGELELGLTKIDSTTILSNPESDSSSDSHKKTNGVNSNCDNKELNSKSESDSTNVSEDVDLLTSSASK